MKLIHIFYVDIDQYARSLLAMPLRCFPGPDQYSKCVLVQTDLYSIPLDLLTIKCTKLTYYILYSAVR